MKVYKPSEFAKKIGVSVRTLMRWDLRGKFKAYRTPTNIKYYTEQQYIDYCIKSGIPYDDIDIDDGRGDQEHGHDAKSGQQDT